MKQWHDRLRDRAASVRKSQAEIAREIGQDPSLVGKYFRGEVENPRGNVMEALARAVGVTEEWLRFGIDSDEPRVSTGSVLTSTSFVPVIGRVEGGAWRENHEDLADFDQSEIPVVPNHKYPHAKKYALQVQGRSMDKVVLPGDYVICVSFADTGREIENGDLVVVERTRGSLRECTLKRAKVTRHGYELWPESTDPRHQKPITLNSHEDDTEATVTGLVIAKYADL